MTGVAPPPGPLARAAARLSETALAVAPYCGVLGPGWRRCADWLATSPAVTSAITAALEGHAILNGEPRWVHPLVHALLDALDSPDAGPVPYLCPEAHVIIDGAAWPVTVQRHFDGTPAAVSLGWPARPADTCPACHANLTPHDGGEPGRHDTGCPHARP